MCHHRICILIRSLARALACSAPGGRILLLGFLLTAAQSLVGQTNWFEDFSRDPRGHGWVAFGRTNLFQWNREAQTLDAVWDSAQANSFFYFPLNEALSRQDDFQLGFDLRLDSVQAGVNPNKSSTFQISAGLIAVEAAFRPNFYRASGTDPLTGPRDLIEFDYFPDTGFGATIAPTLISSNTQFATTFNFPLELRTGVWYRVTMAYTAHNSTLTTTVRAGTNEIGPIREVQLPADFTDFRVNALAVNSYSDEGQTPPEFAGSILAQGAIDNFAWASQTPIAPLAMQTTEEKAQIQFLSRRNWRYVLQRTTDFKNWTDVSGVIAGTGEKLTLEDAPGGSLGFYRVRAER